MAIAAQGASGRRVMATRQCSNSRSAEVVPLPDAKIMSFDKEIGRVTSAAFSPGMNRVLGLGYVHRDFTTSGTELTIVWKDAPIKAVVQ